MPESNFSPELSPISMAAVAVSAMPDLKVLEVVGGARHRDYIDSILRCENSRLILVTLPLSQEAENRMGRLVRYLRTFTKGIRVRLPFSIPNILAYEPVKLSGGMTMALVTDHMEGYTLDDVNRDEALSIGSAIAAIHNLSTATLMATEYTQKTAQDCRRDVVDRVNIAHETDMLPQALAERWRDLTKDEELWKFQTTLVKKNFSLHSFRFRKNKDGKGSVSAILDWEDTSIDDPACDLYWLNQLSGDNADSVLEAYESSSTKPHDQNCLERAKLYAELDVAQILIDGISSKNEELINSAKRLLVELNRLHEKSRGTTPAQAIHRAESLLQKSPAQTFGVCDKQDKHEIHSDNLNDYSEEKTYYDTQVPEGEVLKNSQHVREFLGGEEIVDSEDAIDICTQKNAEDN